MAWVGSVIFIGDSSSNINFWLDKNIVILKMTVCSYLFCSHLSCYVVLEQLPNYLCMRQINMTSELNQELL